MSVYTFGDGYTCVTCGVQFGCGEWGLWRVALLAFVVCIYFEASATVQKALFLDLESKHPPLPVIMPVVWVYPLHFLLV